MDIADLRPEDVTPDTNLPELGDRPPAPELVAPGPLGEDDLTAGQRDWLTKLVGETWTVAVDGEVTAWHPDTDGDGRPVARLHLTTTDGLDIEAEVRPPLPPDEVTAHQEATQAVYETHRAELDDHDTELRAHQHLASLHRARATAIRAAAEREAQAANEVAAAQRFNDAVDARVRAVLAEANVAPPGA